MTDATFIQMAMQGGFTVLAAFLVWRMARNTEEDRKAAQDRETRMATRINDLETTLINLVSRNIESQTGIATAISGLKSALESRPCFLGKKNVARGA